MVSVLLLGFIVNFKQISHCSNVFIATLSIFLLFTEEYLRPSQLSAVETFMKRNASPGPKYASESEQGMFLLLIKFLLLLK